MVQTMQAVVISEPTESKNLCISEYPIPTCGPDEVIIRIKAAGINYIDIYLRSGAYRPEKYPFILGKEGSGIIAARGKEVRGLNVGDRVAFCNSSSGSYAEFATVKSDQVIKLPPNISFIIGAACLLQGLTAYYLSHLTFNISAKHQVLIHAGAGGVGLLLIQMAKLKGAKVFTTVSNEDKAKLALNAGADIVINYTKESFFDAIKSYTEGRGVDVVYDAVGKSTFDESLKSLAIRGMMVSYGQASGPVPAFDLARLSEKSLFITRPVLFHYTHTKKELNDMAEALFKMIEEDQLKVLIGQQYAFSNVALSHADLETRQTIGKSILSMNNV